MITLFYTLGKKYENLAIKSISAHANLCENPIKKIFLIIDPNIDQNTLKNNLQKSIKNCPPIEIITDEDAIDILNYKGLAYQRIVKDKHYLQQMFKLHIDIFTNEEKNVVGDADGLILKPVNYFDNGKDVIFYDDLIYPRPEWTHNFFDENIDINHDFITEKMLFSADILKDFRNKYEHKFLSSSEHRHALYDMTDEEYEFFRGADYPKTFNNWESLPKWVQNELYSFIGDRLIPTFYFFKFSEYILYASFALKYHSDKVVLKKTKIRSGPFSETTDQDIFINRGSKDNCPIAFEYVYQIFNK